MANDLALISSCQMQTSRSLPLTLLHSPPTMHVSSTSTDLSFEEGSSISPTTPPFSASPGSTNTPLSVSLSPRWALNGRMDEAPTPPPKDYSFIQRTFSTSEPVGDSARHNGARSPDSPRRTESLSSDTQEREGKSGKPGFIKQIKRLGNKISKPSLRGNKQSGYDLNNRNGSSATLPPVPKLITSISPGSSISLTPSISSNNFRAVRKKSIAQFINNARGKKDGDLSLEAMDDIDIDEITDPTIREHISVSLENLRGPNLRAVPASPTATEDYGNNPRSRFEGNVFTNLAPFGGTPYGGDPSIEYTDNASTIGYHSRTQGSYQASVFEEDGTVEGSDVNKVDGTRGKWEPPEGWYVQVKDKEGKNAYTSDAENPSVIPSINLIEDIQRPSSRGESTRQSTLGAEEAEASYSLCVVLDEVDKEYIVSCTYQDTVEKFEKKLYGIIPFKPKRADTSVRNPLTAQVDGKEYELHRLYLRERGRERLLEPNERPAKIARQRLLQAGYTEDDNLAVLGKTALPFLLTFFFRSDRLESFSLSSSRKDRTRAQPIFRLLNPNGIEVKTVNLIHELSDEEDVAGTVKKIRERLGENILLADLRLKGLQAIPTVCYQLASVIKILDISNNPLLELPFDYVEQCGAIDGDQPGALEELRVSAMAMKRVPQHIHSIDTLKVLDLSSNHLQGLLNPALATMPRLQELRVQNNALTDLPSFLHLRRLNISNNKFIDLPSNVCLMRQLEYLDISFNLISELPAEIGQLTKLRELNIAGNKVETLPSRFRELKRLETFDCRRNVITDVSALCELPFLREVKADNNAICSINFAFISKNPIKLELTHNRIRQFILNKRDCLATQMAHVCYLDVSHSELSEIPEPILDVLKHSLIVLRLDYNQFQTLPEKLCSFRKLQVLSCSDNQLEYLPAGIGELQSLKYFDVHNNKLTQVPSGIWKCPLKRINMTSNFINVWYDSPPSTFTLQNSLKELYLGDNRFEDDVFHPLNTIKGLEVLNLSFNQIQEIPPFWFRSLKKLERLYLSGNRLASLPTENLDQLEQLKELFLNGNRLQTLPSKLTRLKSLMVIDVGSNFLDYNIYNHQYDWNWNYNTQLRYVNLSGNAYLKVVQPPTRFQEERSRKPTTFQKKKPIQQSVDPVEYDRLPHLKVLGALGVKEVEKLSEVSTESRRVRVQGVGDIRYGIADTLSRRGNNMDLGMFDLVKYSSTRQEALIGVFGLFHPPPENAGNQNFANFLRNSFYDFFMEEKKKAPNNIRDAMRRAFLELNIAFFYQFVTRPREAVESRSGTDAKGRKGSEPNAFTNFKGGATVASGAEAAVVYILRKTMYAANVGRAHVVVSRRGEGDRAEANLLTQNHDPFDPDEASRIRAAEGWVSPNRLVNDVVDVSRAFGHYSFMPAVNAAPCVSEYSLSDDDEFVIIANRGLWDYITYQTAVDIAHIHKDEPVIAAQKLRDFAMSYGASGSIMILVVPISGQGLRVISGPTDEDPDKYIISRIPQRHKTEEVAIVREEPPTGHVALVFTDIRNSTLMWETYPGMMRDAIKIHHDLLRRLLRDTGGYEVKTEGDAFMVAFSDVLCAVHWAIMIQQKLLTADWPPEILTSEEGRDVYDSEGHLIARGLSVRTGVHWGHPYCERDPVTHRYDYFGPMVNRSARINGVAAGGQIMSSWAVVNAIMDRVWAEDAVPDPDPKLAAAFHALKSITIYPAGYRQMKGLEKPEFVSVIYPKELAGRHELDETLTQPVTGMPQVPGSLPDDEPGSSEDDYEEAEKTDSDDMPQFSRPLQVIRHSPQLSLELDNSGGLISPTSMEKFGIELTHRIKESARDVDTNVEVPSFAELVRNTAHLCFRLEALSSHRILRPPMAQTESTDDSNILYVDPDIFLPVLEGRSEPELSLLLDLYSVRITNVLSTLHCCPMIYH